MPIMLSFGSWRQEDQRFKVIFDYLRPRKGHKVRERERQREERQSQTQRLTEYFLLKTQTPSSSQYKYLVHP